jgi:hypothetical protein
LAIDAHLESFGLIGLPSRFGFRGSIRDVRQQRLTSTPLSVIAADRSS